MSWWQPVSGDYFCPDGVDMIDLGYLAECWLDENGDESGKCGRADLNGDTIINFTDFAIFADKWLTEI